MDDIYEVRRANLATLIDQKFGGNKSRFSREMGFKQPGLTYRLLASEGKRKQIGTGMARRIEQVCGADANWLDNPREQQEHNEATVMVDLCRECWPKNKERAMENNDTVNGPLPVAAAWVRRHLPNITSVGNLRALTAYSDSMSPTFNDGDILFIDHGVRDITHDGVFVFSGVGDLEEVYIKRVQRRLDGALMVISDNPRYGQPQEVPQKTHLNVLGRVVYAWTGSRM